LDRLHAQAVKNHMKFTIAKYAVSYLKEFLSGKCNTALSIQTLLPGLDQGSIRPSFGGHVTEFELE
jgi:hypothetical protein